MSASKKKQTNHETVQGFGDPKTAREAETRKKQKRTDRMYALIGVLFVLVAIFVVTWNSGMMEKTTAATISHTTGGSESAAVTASSENLSAVEVNYYFQNAYSGYANSQYASYFGLTASTDLKNTSCPMAEEGQTWYDFLLAETTKNMGDIAALNAAAKAEGFTVEDLQTQIDEYLENMSTQLKVQNTTVKEYLKRTYGKGMSMSSFKALLADQIVAQEYQNNYMESLTYTDSDISDAYNKNTQSYDVVDYESLLVSGTAEATTDAEGAEVEPTEEAQAAAMAKSKETADKLYVSFQADQTLEELAATDDATSYANNEATAYSDSVTMNWLFDDARKTGDSTVVQAEGVGTYILFFGSRYRQEYSTVNVRHILLTPEATTLAEDDANYETDVAEKKAAAKADAEALLAEWKSGGATEDSFAALAEEKSEDGGSQANGGLYERVAQGQMVETFNDWCFDAARKTGDSGIVETDYGYHIMYFVGFDLPYWKIQVETDLKNADFSEWSTSKTENAAKVTTDGFGMRFVG